MRKYFFTAALALVIVTSGFHASVSADGKDSGSFSVLTYNVAGLPEGISSSHPMIFNKKISPGLNDFDLVLVQEDFFYHKDLTSRLTLPYIGQNGGGRSLGDGLARFSLFPFTKVDHVAWQACYGTLGHANDCLTPKGYSFATHTIAPGVEIDVYNLHMDAGHMDGDNEAKSIGVGQLIERINKTSKGKAVIVAGDTNIKRKRPAQAEMIDRLLAETGLRDTAAELGMPDRIDRIMYRSGVKVSLAPVAYKVEEEKFSTAKGWPLSDHEAVSAVMEWKLIGD